MFAVGGERGDNDLTAVRARPAPMATVCSWSLTAPRWRCS